MVQSGRYLKVPPAMVGERPVQVSLPHGVLAIGPELDVWRTVGPVLWSKGRGSVLTDYQAADLALEAAKRWAAFAEEMVREWLPAMVGIGAPASSPLA